MSSDEEELGKAASYSARLTSFGTEGRRSSFGAKLAEDVSAEGGALDRAIAISKPSDLPTFNPFKVTTNAVDPELFIAAQEDANECRCEQYGLIRLISAVMVSLNKLSR